MHNLLDLQNTSTVTESYWAPTIDNYNFLTQNCAILQINNYKFGQKEREGYIEDQKMLKYIREKFNSSQMPIIPQKSVENKTKEARFPRSEQICKRL